jgi:multimeric flavodoxin WrbA
MKVLMINGSPNENGCTYRALSEAKRIFDEAGIESEIVQIGKKPVAGCIACGKCYETHKCIFDDKVNDLLARAQEFDGMVVGSPVYYAGPAGQLCAFLDRLFYASRGCWHGKVGAAVVSCRRGGATAAFDRLNKYFTISNMPVAPSQYWNMVHGNRPEEVLQDKEGLQIMRTLGKNIAWMVDGTKQVCQPQYEPRVSTNFIR